MKKLGFGQRITDARKAAGYSQKALMDALGWPNDSNSRMSGYENEVREPTLADFIAIANLCHVDPAYLAFGDYRLGAKLDRLVTAYQSASPDIQFAVEAALRITSRDNQKKAAE